jgi:xylulokinase
MSEGGPYLVGVDLGSSGCKAAVFGPDLALLVSAQAGYAPRCPVPGAVELELDEVWAALRSALRSALGGALPAGSERASFALCFAVLGDALVATVRGGEALGPALLSSDTRSAPLCLRIGRDLGDEALVRTTGRRAHPMTVLPRIMWLRERDRAAVDDATVYQDLQGWLLDRLGVGAVTDPSLASGFLLYDLERRAWSGELLRYAGLHEGQLPRVQAAGSAAGLVPPGRAAELGFPPGAKVIAVVGAQDQPCNLLGAGAVAEGDALLSLGTVACLSLVLAPGADWRVLADGGYYRAPTALPGQYMTQAIVWSGGAALRWFAERILASPHAPAREADAYERLLEGTATPRGLLFLPHLCGAGTPGMDPLSRGALVGLTLATDAASIAQAIVEGVAFEQAVNLRWLEWHGMRVGGLFAVGGGSRSDAWLALCADVLGRVVKRLAASDGCLGAALLAAQGAGLVSELPAAARTAARTAATFAPSPRQAAFAAKLDLYLRLRGGLTEISHALAGWEAAQRGDDVPARG